MTPEDEIKIKDLCNYCGSKATVYEHKIRKDLSCEEPVIDGFKAASELFGVKPSDVFYNKFPCKN